MDPNEPLLNMTDPSRNDPNGGIVGPLLNMTDPSRRAEQANASTVAVLDAMSDGDFNAIATPVYASKRGASFIQGKEILGAVAGAAAGIVLGLFIGRAMKKRR